MHKYLGISFYFLLQKKALATLLVLWLLLFPCLTYSANFFLSPQAGTYEVGTTLSVGIYANGGNSVFNAVSGALSFPEDVLQVTSLSKNQSIISLWVQEPTFSNSEGSIRFEGITLNPGYSGSSGKILTVNFKVKTPGVASVAFTSGSILANDGAGSELHTSSSKGQYTFIVEDILEREVSNDEPNESNEAQSRTVAPQVVSETHAHDTWTNKTAGLFNFEYAKEATALRLLLDTKADTIPTVVYEPAIRSREIDDLPEGISYLHVQYRTEAGWSECTSRA